MCAGVCSFPFVAGVVREMMKLMDDSDSFRHDDTTPAQEQEATRKATEAAANEKIARHSLHLYRRAQLYRQHLHDNIIQMRSTLRTLKFHKFNFNVSMLASSIWTLMAPIVQLSFDTTEQLQAIISIIFKSFDINCADLQTCRRVLACSKHPTKN